MISIKEMLNILDDYKQCDDLKADLLDRIDKFDKMGFEVIGCQFIYESKGVILKCGLKE